MKILTFDIEDWFHILDNEETKSSSEWNKFDSRIRLGMDLIYNILEKTEKSATFFVVGWMAEKYPEIIREISDRGFEIGSHTHMHQLAYEQDRKTFYNDVEKSIKTLEDCTGKKVTSFRAPGFSITKNNKWAFEVLHELGVTKDSSVFPAGRAHGGLPSYRSALPSIIEYNGIKLKEFPINTHNILSKPFIFSGGGYFRILPYEIIRNWTFQSDYVMTYFHPRDFDKDQPMLQHLPLVRKFKSYYGIQHSGDKFDRYISDFQTTTILNLSKDLDWDSAKKYII